MEETPFRVRVDCYAGHQAEETPRRVHIGQRVLEVTEVVDRWLDPTHRYFKVVCDNEGIYLLRHDVRSDVWELTASL